MVELSIIKDFTTTVWRGSLDPLPDSVLDTFYWQYGNGDHSSEARRILDSIVMQMRTSQNNIVEVRHLVIDGSSQ